MPVIILIDSTEKYIPQITEFFKEKYRVLVMKEQFKCVRSAMSTQEEETLYLVPGLTKPERYEIFCLSRKNNQQFISLADASMENSKELESDKHKVFIEAFDGHKLSEKLLNSRITPTTANKRSKGVSLKSITELKRVMNEVKKKYPESASLIIHECEEIMTKMWNFNSQNSVEEAEECFIKMIEIELKRKRNE